MTDQSGLKRAFAEYARTIACPYDIGEVLYRLTARIADVLDIDGAAASLADPEGGLAFVTATDERIVRAEQTQINADDGPCHDAFTSGAWVTVADLGPTSAGPSSGRPPWRRGCTPCPASRCRSPTSGSALDLYRSRPQERPADELEDAQLLADVATGYVLNARALHEGAQLASQLQRALDSRVVIEQAKGIIGERHGIDPAAAFDLLRRHARSNQRKLHDMPRAVVERRLHI